MSRISSSLGRTSVDRQYGQAIDVLRESEQRFRGAFEHAAIGMALVALDGSWIQTNAALCDIVGYSEAEMHSVRVQAITHPDDLDTGMALIRQLIDGTVQRCRMVKRYLHKSGRIVWVSLSLSLVHDADGSPLHFVAQIQDITENKRREWLEADHRDILEMVARDRPLDATLERIVGMLERQVQGAKAAVMLVGGEGIRLVAPNLPADFAKAIQARAISLAAGLSGDDQSLHVSRIADDMPWQSLREVALGHQLRICWSRIIRSGDGLPHGLITLYCEQDAPPAENEVESMHTAANLATIAVEHDTASTRLAHLTQHDPLTCLPNRMLLDDRFEQALALARRSGKFVAVLALDLDHFKSVNDSLGHQVGDHLLQLFAQRLRAQLRDADTLARTGGDEFTAVLPELADPTGAATAAQNLVDSLREPFEIAGQSVRATASIGIAVFPRDGQTPVQLQEHADAALYRAKAKGRNGASF